MPLLRYFKESRVGRGGLLLGLVAGLVGFRLLPTDDLEVLRRIVLSVQQFYDKGRPETVYLHLDKNTYTAGETVWLRAYVADAARHRLDTLSRVLHVELLSDRQQLVSRRTLELRGGLGSGDLMLADTLTPGTYLLRAYTTWMRNAGPDFFYTRRLQVWPAAPAEAVPENRPAFRRATAQAQRRTARVSHPPDVQFFAEGGNLVAGLDNVVAFKAVDYAGSSLPVAGQVLDGQGQAVATFQSRHGGMGTLHFTPAAGQRYRAAFSTPALAALSVPLPAVQASGYVLQVVPGADDFTVTIRQQGGAGGPVLLLGQVGSTVGYIGRGVVQGQEAFMAHVPKSKFASGIVHFTLFDGEGRPLAERLAFARNQGALRVSLTPDRTSYGAHQPVRVRVAVADASGRPVATQLSLAVVDADAISASADNIAARLLLTADLAGYVEEPGYYFQNPSPETDQALDDLLLTQGWRRFAWPAVLAGQAPSQEFGVERSLSVLGQVTRPDGKPLAQSTLSFLMAKPSKQLFSTVTDAEGRFLFTDFGGCDTVRATLQARSERGKRNVLITLDQGPAWPTRPLPLLPAEIPAALAPVIRRSQEGYATENQYLLSTGQSVRLANVAVAGQRAPVDDPRRLYPVTSSLVVVDMNDIPTARNGGTTVLQALQSRVPGLTVSGSEPNITVSMRGNRSFSGANSPLIILDGTRTTITALAFYQAVDIERVEILKPGNATIFGSEGVDGVIAVYTRRGNVHYDTRKEAVPGVLSLKLPGYNCPRQFYAPRYGAGAPAPTRPDPRRTTLYWAPTVRTDASGQAEIAFYTSDATGSFRVVAEGISGAGQPALGSGILEVK
jgi:hypothetical protein